MNYGDNEIVEIPWQSLSREALQGLIDAYVLQEGTDYGHQDYHLQDKADQVMQQLQQGKIVIVYDLDTESATLIHKELIKNAP